MKATTVRENIFTTFIMIEFVKGNLDTKSAVDSMMSLIQKKLGMSVEQAAEFFRSAIGTNN